MWLPPDLIPFSNFLQINLIYLGLITDRVAIIPEFIPSHIGGHVPPIPFGEVFDVPRLRNELGKPVLEWREVKVRYPNFIYLFSQIELLDSRTIITALSSTT